MDVILVRHAIAEKRDASRWPEDALRPLTDHGRERFSPAARGITELVEHVDLVLASPYVRAWQTAEILAEEAGWPDPDVCTELAAHAPVTDALVVLTRLPSDITVACIGHEPNMTILAQSLVRPKDAHELGWFKKGGAAHVRFKTGVVVGGGRLLWACTPKELRQLDA